MSLPDDLLLHLYVVKDLTSRMQERTESLCYDSTGAVSLTGGGVFPILTQPAAENASSLSGDRLLGWEFGLSGDSPSVDGAEVSELVPEGECPKRVGHPCL